MKDYEPSSWEYRISHYEPEAYDVTVVGVGAIALVKSEADARLIAAAPDLLDALEGLLNALPSATTHPAIKAAKAAIAKATGEEK